MGNQQQNIYSALNIYSCEFDKKLPQKQTQLAYSNQNPKRYDKNGDEILWQLKRKNNVGFRLVKLWSCFIAFICIAVSLFVIFLPFIMTRDVSNAGLFVWVLSTLLIIVGFGSFLKLILESIVCHLNTKDMYLTNKKLYIIRHIGSNIEAPLGSFIIYSDFIVYNVSFSDIYDVSLIQNRQSIYNIIDFADSNICDIFPLLKPAIVDYLLNCEIKEFRKFFILYSAHIGNAYEKYDIDYKELERLRGSHHRF
ncbi:hypothetical protein [Helicobacter sp. T3_23-1056]